MSSINAGEILVGLIVAIVGALIVWLVKGRVERMEQDQRETDAKTDGLPASVAVQIERACAGLVKCDTCTARHQTVEAKLDHIANIAEHNQEVTGRIFERLDDLSRDQARLSAQLDALIRNSKGANHGAGNLD